MNKKLFPLLLLIVNALLIAFIVSAFLNLRFPMVGDDYSLALPYLLDNSLYQHLNGLSIHWYTSTFGGGLPDFPNPNSVQYSLPVFLAMFMPPWNAVVASTVIFILIGFSACYYLFTRVFKFHWTSGLLGAIFFSANGFILLRASEGHLGYQTFPLIAVSIILLLDHSLPRWIAGLLFSLIPTLLIYEAGYFLIVVFGLSIPIVLLLAYLYRPEMISWKRILTVILIGGVVSLVISAAKMAAIFSYMRFFPRHVTDSYPVGIIQGLLGVVFQLLGTMNLAPALKIVGINTASLEDLFMFVTGAAYGPWEFDMSLSPMVFIILIVGAYTSVRKFRKSVVFFRSDKKWIALFFLIGIIWITVEFILAKGYFYPFLRTLPILSSLHVNPRFTAAFIFPLAMLAALVYDNRAIHWSPRKSMFIFGLVNIFTLLPLATYFMVDRDLQDRAYDVSESFSIYESIRRGETFEITAINAELGNTQALAQHESNLYPYEPIFGYKLGNFHPEIQPGPVWIVTEGYYNMTNPSGYVFPEINDTRPFERVKVGDEENLTLFLNHQKTNWKIPVYQQVLDWVSGITFVIALGVLAGYGLFALFKHRRNTPQST